MGRCGPDVQTEETGSFEAMQRAGIRITRSTAEIGKSMMEVLQKV